MAESIDSKCRLCGANNGRFFIPIDENKPNTLSDKIFKCLGIEIEKNDSNRRICVQCTIDINEVYSRLFPSKAIPNTEPLSERVLDESLHSSETTSSKPESMESSEFGSNIVTLRNVNAASTPNQEQVVRDPLDAKKNKRKKSKANSCPLCEKTFVYMSNLCKHIKEKHFKTKLPKINTAKGAPTEDSSELEANVTDIVSTPKRKNSKARKRIVALNHTIVGSLVKTPRVQKQSRLRPIKTVQSGQRRSKSPIQSTASASFPISSTPSFRPIPAQKTINAEVKSTATTSPCHPLRKSPALRSNLVSTTFVSRWLDEADIPSNEDAANPSILPIAELDSLFISKSKKSPQKSSTTKSKYHQMESILTQYFKDK